MFNKHVREHEHFSMLANMKWIKSPSCWPIMFASMIGRGMVHVREHAMFANMKPELALQPAFSGNALAVGRAYI